MRKKLYVAVVVGLFVFSCFPATAKKLTLRYALWDQNQRPAMEASIAEFMKNNPDIDVKVELYPWADYWTKLTTGLATGTAPDVFWGHLAWFPSMVTRGQLLDLQPYIDRDKVDLSPYYPALVEAWKYQGDSYGIPKDWDTIALFINKEMIAKAGLVYPADLKWNPIDGGSFLRYIQKLTLDNTGRNALDPNFDPTNIVQYGFASENEPQPSWLNFVWENGGTGIINRPWGTKVVIDQPQTIAVLQFLNDLIYKYHVSPKPEARGVWPGPWSLWTGKKVAMVTNGSWMLPSARSQASFPWDVAPLPAGPAGRISVFNGLAHEIPATCKHKEEAWKLCKWMDSPASQKIVSEMGIVFPAVKDLIPTFLKAFAGKKPEHIRVFIDETANTGWWPITEKWPRMWDVMQREFDLLWLGQYKTAEEAVKKVAVELRGIMKASE